MYNRALKRNHLNIHEKFKKLNQSQPKASIRAWKCNFPLFKEIMSDRRTDREVTLKITHSIIDYILAHIE